MKKCTKCSTPKEDSEFYLEKKRGKMVRRAQCIECRLAYSRARRRRLYAERKMYINEVKSVPCSDCGLSFPPYVMDFHHLNRDSKFMDIGPNILGSWEKVLEEISKCKVVCARCHRLYSSRVSKTGRKRSLLRRLKSRSCADCGGEFHYSQMDFDHVRGTKVSALANISGSPLSVILPEVRKCDVVCANCHRHRTQQRLDGKVINFATDWSEFLDSDLSWTSLVGTMEDQAVAAMVGIPVKQVIQYRMSHRIPVFRKKKGIPWQSLVGKLTDSKVAIIGAVTKSAVGHYRRRLGIPPFRREAKV